MRDPIKRFYCIEKQGKSTKRVIEGLVLPSGKTIITWLKSKESYDSIAIYNSFGDFKFIHIDSYNDIEIMWMNEVDSISMVIAKVEEAFEVLSQLHIYLRYNDNLKNINTYTRFRDVET